MDIAEFEKMGRGSYGHTKILTAGPYAGRFAHLAAMLTTVDVMVSSEDGPITRWCYPGFVPALKALQAWDGIGDPPGEWIKQKPENRNRVPGKFDK